MQATLFNQHPEWLTKPPTFLAPNNRLAREIEQLFAEAQDLTAWHTPLCLSWQAWQHSLWQQLQIQYKTPGQLLTDGQEKVLWQQIIQQQSQSLLFPPGVVRQATQAWQWIHQFQVPLDDPRLVSTDSGQQFAQWAQIFAEQLNANHWISPAQLSSRLLEPELFSELTLPSELVLTEFPTLLPDQLKWIDRLKETGCKTQHYSETETRAITTKTSCADVDQEILASALWAKQILETNSQSRIGIVFPELAQQQHRIERIFNQVFHQTNEQVFEDRQAPGYNLSASTPATEQPVIAHALSALQLNRQEVEQNRITEFLTSPFFNHSSTELSQRCQLDADIRLEKNLTIRTSELLKVAEQHSLAPGLVDNLKGFFKSTPKYSQQANKMPLWHWLNLFQQQLQILGWPGDRTLDTLEYQQASLWTEILERCASLEQVNAYPIAINEALQLLQNAAQDIPFHLQTADSPIQILGILESRGLSFTHLRINGMDHNSWPPAPNPNHLLPLDLQKELNMPQCSAEKELDYAQAVSLEWQCHCDNLLISRCQSQDGQELHPSSLFPVSEETLFIHPEDTISEVELEMWQDKKVLSFNTQKLVGGAGYIRDFIHCPFKAQLTYPMNSASLIEPVLGLDSQDRGILVHDCLQKIWNQLKNQQSLLKLSEQQQLTLLSEIVEQTLANYLARQKRRIGWALQQLEIDRLINLLDEWLNIERSRLPFTVIINESKRQFNLGQVQLDIRFDRIDKLHDGSLMVIDYKTGSTQVRDWYRNETIPEPQVPIYCLIYADEISAAAFGRLKAGKIALEGISDLEELQAGNFKSVAEVFSKTNPELDTFATLMQRWHDCLQITANEIATGSVSVTPLSPESCRYCEQASICRYHLRSAKQ